MKLLISLLDSHFFKIPSLIFLYYSIMFYLYKEEDAIYLTLFVILEDLLVYRLLR